MSQPLALNTQSYKAMKDEDAMDGITYLGW